MAKAKDGDNVSGLSARAWNRHDESSDDYHRHRARGVAQPDVPPPPRDPNTIKVLLTGAGNLLRGSVVCLGTPAIDPLDQQNIWFNFATQAPESPFAITLQAEENNKLVECIVTGGCLARVNVLDVDHRFAAVASSQSALQSAGWGPVKLLQVPPSTGVHLLPVHLHYEPRVEIVLVSSLTKTGNFYPGGLLHADVDGTITNISSVWILDLNEDA